MLGGKPVSLSDIDIRAVNTSLVINNEQRAKGAANQVMGNPLIARGVASKQATRIWRRIGTWRRDSFRGHAQRSAG